MILYCTLAADGQLSNRTRADERAMCTMQYHRTQLGTAKFAVWQPIEALLCFAFCFCSTDVEYR